METTSSVSSQRAARLSQREHELLKLFWFLRQYAKDELLPELLLKIATLGILVHETEARSRRVFLRALRDLQGQYPGESGLYKLLTKEQREACLASFSPSQFRRLYSDPTTLRIVKTSTIRCVLNFKTPRQRSWNQGRQCNEVLNIFMGDALIYTTPLVGENPDESDEDLQEYFEQLPRTRHRKWSAENLFF